MVATHERLFIPGRNHLNDAGRQRDAGVDGRRSSGRVGEHQQARSGSHRGDVERRRMAAEAGETVTGWPGEALGAGLQVPDGIVTLKLPVYPASVTVTGAGVALSDVNATVVGAATGNAGVGVGAGAELVGAGKGVGAEALIA